MQTCSTSHGYPLQLLLATNHHKALYPRCTPPTPPHHSNSASPPPPSAATAHSPHTVYVEAGWPSKTWPPPLGAASQMYRIWAPAVPWRGSEWKRTAPPPCCVEPGTAVAQSQMEGSRGRGETECSRGSGRQGETAGREIPPLLSFHLIGFPLNMFICFTAPPRDDSPTYLIIIY